MSKPIQLLQQKMEHIETSQTNKEDIKLLKKAIAFGVADYTGQFSHDGSTFIDTTHLNMDIIGKAQCMFEMCANLKVLNTSNWCKGFLTNAQEMFLRCESLEQLDVSKWDTSNLSNAKNMFMCCHSLKYLDVSNWNTSSLVNAEGMFDYCDSLPSLDMSSWDLSSLENGSGMFQRCYSLKNLTLTGASVKKLAEVESSCYSIIYPNASSMDDKMVNLLTGEMTENSGSYFVVSSATPKTE